MSKVRAKKIKVIVFDVDGVLTDGTIWIVPSGGKSAGPIDPLTLEALADQGGYSVSSPDFTESKGFNAHDGTGITLAKLAGIKTAFITKRISQVVAIRARDLKIDYVYLGQADKSQALQKIAAAENVKLSEIAFLGDDIVDLPAMRKCGLAMAVKNSRKEVLAEAHYVTPSNGGHGAARDAIEYVLKSQGKFKKVLDEYITTRQAAQKKANASR
ncbi:MAG TPA: HAD hydrolase family protein [Terriglobales bacterium]|nr:HAD hydrolase family protein [Terriglobales bacterium]